MKNQKSKLSSSEKELNKMISSGEIKSVFIPRIKSASDILKYQLCSEIIRYKKEFNLAQADIAKLAVLNKSEVSKIFSYKLEEFSSDRLLNMIQKLIDSGANIKLENVFEEVKKKIKSLERKLSHHKKNIQPVQL
jgi:predicted XRE-type DNA-binding protein